MGQTFSRLIVDVDFESGCYSHDRGCFSKILRNSVSCDNPKRRNITVFIIETAKNVSFMYTFEKIRHFCPVV